MIKRQQIHPYICNIIYVPYLLFSVPYLLDTKTYTLEVVPNQTTTQEIVNEKPTGTFTLVKKNADKNTVFCLHHFSHNGKLNHEDLVNEAKNEKLEYDFNNLINNYKRIKELLL